MTQRVEFQTGDGINIVGNWVEAPGTKRAVILLHMMPATKESWDEVAKKLEERGMSSLAIDLRGHGESSGDQNKPSVADIDAAVEWLGAHGYQQSQISLVGASIGANLALVFSSNHPTISTVVLLSPGLDYHGIRTEDAMKRLSDRTRILLLSSTGDAYSANTVAALAALDPNAKTDIFEGTSHGTALFLDRPETLTEALDFLR